MIQACVPQWAVVSVLAASDGTDQHGLEKAAGPNRVASPEATESYALGLRSAPAVAGAWAIPWNAPAGAGRLGSGIPKSDFWASAKERIDQVGCVYTAQAFGFDSVGVIFGPDLVYRPMDPGWVGQRHESRDRIVSRGVTDAGFMDAPTRDFFLRRAERNTRATVHGGAATIASQPVTRAR